MYYTFFLDIIKKERKKHSITIKGNPDTRKKQQIG